MALDPFRIASQGVFPTPTPTGASRMASAVSQGLINFTLPAPPDTPDDFLAWGSRVWGKVKWGFKKWG